MDEPQLWRQRVEPGSIWRDKANHREIRVVLDADRTIRYKWVESTSRSALVFNVPRPYFFDRFAPAPDRP